MRRSRVPLTAWPAFADLMTVLAVIGLAIAAVAVGGSSGGDPNETISVLERRIAELRHKLDDANETTEEQLARIRELELRDAFPGGLPCLWNPGPRIRVVPLLQVVVASDYAVTPLWPPERHADVADIPRLADIEQGQMDVEEFERYANEIYQHGVRADTFDRSCRFYVELKQGGTELLAFSRAFGVVNQYFLISNSTEVNRILRGEE